MSTHDEMADTLAAHGRRQTARLIHVGRDMAIREYDLTGYDPDERTSWYVELSKQFDLTVEHRVEYGGFEFGDGQPKSKSWKAGEDA